MTRGLRRALATLVVTAVMAAAATTSAAFAQSSASPTPAAALKPGMLSVVNRQASTGTYGSALIAGCTWATWVSRCQNLTVYGNGSSFDDAGCGAPNGCTFGPEFQCTELAQRYAYYAWGEPATWDGYGGANGSAAQMWQAGPALPVPLQQFAQGGGVPPQRGDLLVFGPGWLGSYYDSNGHVAVINSVASSTLTIVQENGTPSGTDTLALNGTTVSANGYTPIIGWLHNPVMSLSGGAKLSASSANGQQNLFWQGADNHLREAWLAGATWYGPTDLTAAWAGTAPLTSAPSAVFAATGQQTVYWRGSGGHLWQAVYTNGWTQPTDLSTSWTATQMLQSAPVAALTPSGQQLVYWQGPNGTLMEAWYSGGSWYGPADLAAGWGGVGPLTSAPSVALAGDGTQLVYWQGTGGHLWEAWYGGGAWNGPVDLSKSWPGSGQVGSSPSVVVLANGDQHVFWRGTDNHVWQAWFNGAWHGPADWDSLGTVTASPTATVNSAGKAVIYWQNAVGDLASATWNGSWNGPADLSAAWGNTGLLASAPSVAISADGSTQLAFWRGGNGHLMEAWYVGGWYGPADLSARWGSAGLLAGAPSVAVTPDGSAQLVFWQGINGHLWEAWYTGAWNGPIDLTASWGGSTVGSAPSVWVSPDSTQQTVFWRGADGHLEEAWYAGSWNGPVDWTSRWGSPLLASAPSAVITPGGAQQLVFWQDTAGHLQEAWYAGSWNGPSDWSTGWSGAALLVSSPAAVVTAGGSQLVFWQGANGHLWEAWWGGGRTAPIDWAAAGNVAAPVASSPSVALQGGEQLVFWRSPNGHLAETWWGGPWSAPVDVSGIGPLT
jgi:hypothetical protein